MRASAIKRPIKTRRALNKLSFEDLALFESVAGHESLSSAARDLQLRAPYVTKAIQRLEKNLSVQLLTRTTRGISLTQQGREFLGFCKKVSETVDDSPWMEP